MRSLCPALYAIMFIKLCFNFISIFAYLSLMWSVTFFFCLAPGSSCAILSQAGLPEVPVTYVGSLENFLTLCPVY
jgi:hypothetical protein